MADKVRVAIIGLGFGAEFIPIYQAHPNAEMYAICRRNKAELDKVRRRFGIKTRYTDYDELLKDPNVDAVHINTPDSRSRPAERSPRSRPASTSPAPCRWPRRSTSAGRSSKRSSRAARST